MTTEYESPEYIAAMNAFFKHIKPEMQSEAIKRVWLAAWKGGINYQCDQEAIKIVKQWKEREAVTR